MKMTELLDALDIEGPRSWDETVDAIKSRMTGNSSVAPTNSTPAGWSPRVVDVEPGSGDSDAAA